MWALRLVLGEQVVVQECGVATSGQISLEVGPLREIWGFGVDRLVEVLDLIIHFRGCHFEFARGNWLW